MTTAKEATRHTKEKLMSMVRRDQGASAWRPEASWPDDRADRIFRDLVRDVLTGSMWDRLAMFDRFGPDSIASPMHLEEFLEDGMLVIRAELPGLSPEKDIHLTVQDGVLDLRAERQERTREELPGAFRSEFRYGLFRRSVRLPDGVSEEEVKASYKDGILDIRVPYGAEPVPPATIPIEHG